MNLIRGTWNQSWPVSIFKRPASSTGTNAESWILWRLVRRPGAADVGQGHDPAGIVLIRPHGHLAGPSTANLVLPK